MDFLKRSPVLLFGGETPGPLVEIGIAVRERVFQEKGGLAGNALPIAGRARGYIAGAIVKQFARKKTCPFAPNFQLAWLIKKRLCLCQ
jgi:hypothetical protein